MNYVLCLCPSERSQILKHVLVFISVPGTHFREAHAPFDRSTLEFMHRITK